MKQKIVVLLLLGALCAGWRALAQECPCPCPATTPAGDANAGPDNGDNGDAAVNQGEDPAAVSVNYFEHRLSPYGRWVYREGYGRVWIPTVAAGWRPYTTGRWVYTDQGWAWMADEPWGWAAFHYGRWFYDDGYGWGWVPGTVWAPAWVSWRTGGGYIGWAPLTPAIGFTAGVGLRFGGGLSLEVGIATSHYCFVSEGAILSTRLATVIVPSERNVTIIHNTTNITNYTVVNNRVVNQGVNVQHIEQVTGHPVPRLQVAASAQAGSGLAQVRGKQVAFYQPATIARAARQVKAESFVNRSTGASTATAGGKGRLSSGSSMGTPASGGKSTSTTLSAQGRGRQGRNARGYSAQSGSSQSGSAQSGSSQFGSSKSSASAATGVSAGSKHHNKSGGQQGGGQTGNAGGSTGSPGAGSTHHRSTGVQGSGGHSGSNPGGGFGNQSGSSSSSGPSHHGTTGVQGASAPSHHGAPPQAPPKPKEKEHGSGKPPL